MPKKVGGKKYTDWLSNNRIQRGLNLNNRRPIGNPEPPPPPPEIIPEVPPDYFLDRDMFNLRYTPLDLSITDISEIPAWELQEYRDEEERRQAAEERHRINEELRQERRREAEERWLEAEQRRLNEAYRQSEEELRQMEIRHRELFGEEEPPRPISPPGLVPIMDAPELGRPDVLPSTQEWLKDNPSPEPERENDPTHMDLEEIEQQNIVFIDAQDNWLNEPAYFDRPINFRRVP